MTPTKRFGLILTNTGKPLHIRLEQRTTAEERKESYDLYADEYLEVMLFSKDVDNKIISSSITLVPEAMRINTLNYEPI